MHIAIIGGGAAGFFAAITTKENFPEAQVTIYEKSQKLLSKVKISGGGRCNVTNACSDLRTLSNFYPRGNKHLRKAFDTFSNKDTMAWFEKRGVPLKIYPDLCVFPQSNDSQSIIDCFYHQIEKLNINIAKDHHLHNIEYKDKKFQLQFKTDIVHVDRVVVTVGGQPKRNGFDFLQNLGLEIIEPVPSLFTFNIPENPIRELMGNVVEKTQVKIEGTKLTGSGPLLITHWGMSGPAVLQLSAWGARLFKEKDYKFNILVNWLNDLKEEDAKKILIESIYNNKDKKVHNYNPFSFTMRLWHFILEKASIPNQLRYKELGEKKINKLISILVNDLYQVNGKTTYKEEFVTAGGVSLKEINIKTMESKKNSGLFFAGEVLDIDGITGGFNFQAAWTTAYIAGINVGKLN